MIPYLITTGVASLYALIRANHDKHINDGKWKRWAVVESALVALLTSLGFGENIADYTFLPVIFALVFSIIFDMACGWTRAKKLFYWGSGKYDQFMKKVFEKPWLFTVFKAMWLFVISGAFFSTIKTYFKRKK